MNLEKQLSRIIARNWWVLLLRGLAAIAFGILAILQPGISLAALVLLFGAYALVDGVLGSWAAISGRREHEHWWVLLLWGLLSIGIGILTFQAPGITALVLLFYIAGWAIATGVLQIVAAVRLRKEIEGEWLLGLGGLASVALGIILMARPAAGAISLLWLIATYAMLFGGVLVLLSLKARKLGTRLAGQSSWRS